ncbi:site-specific integrase [Luteibacter aegosomaticola]|uniref:site-specific integrase n=1 Tax=Luteibacter aegosomaticola TaxID=2911538 RepID=UPI001FFA1A20|nr:site-specific integrase [Luteibacter aegosomaticola]UPG88341.1 site-specific integrase [Luteibacter aegosomaticola]
MRIPHYLVRAPSGVFHFRRRVPAVVATLLKKHVVKKSLGTRELSVGRDLALHLWRAYDELHSVLKVMGMSGKKWDVDELAALLNRRGINYKLKVGADGSIELETKDAADHIEAMEAIDRIGDMRKEVMVQAWMRDGWSPNAPTPTAPKPVSHPSAPIPQATPVSASPQAALPEAVMPLGKATTQWLADIKKDTVPKTLVSKRLALEDFARSVGESTPVHECTRVPIGAWVSELRARDLATPTIVNRLSYVRGFLAWAKGKGFIHFEAHSNPASGQASYGAREKRQRKKHGFRAYNDAQLKLLFAPDNLKKLNTDAQLGMWMGLFTGARVSEIGQLALSDFFDVDGIPCLRITDEGVGQSTKNEVSNRIIPVHPEFIRMGLLIRVERLRAAGERRLFPKSGRRATKAGAAINGQGDWLSKAFGRHLSAILPKPETGKLGFHSFRKTLIQHLQAHGIEAEVRAAYVGHDLDDEHHNTYSDDVPKQQVLDAIQKLDYPVKPDTDAFA